MQKLLGWLDNNLLPILAGFLFIFIPLYPKLPLMDILPGYIVRVRLEDFFVSFCILLWVWQFFRKKIKVADYPLFKPIASYLLIGFLSIISAIFILQTVPFERIHVQKIILHYLRRIEYFSLFFIFFASIKSIKQLKIYLMIFIVTVLGVAFYGFGQKYLYWPAFSTMNREFAKGWMLYLTKHARVLSTFGGHYDLAAFIMMALMVLWSLFFTFKKIFLRILIFGVIAAAFWTLILTASRMSFIAYLVGLTMVFFLWAYRRGMSWSLSRWLMVVTLSILVMLSFGDLSERFTNLLKIDQRIAGIKSLILSPIGKPPEDKALFLENNPKAIIAQITSKSDQPPSLVRPVDVYQDIPLQIPIATGSSEVVSVERTYSKTAFMFDLSTAIRFDALWPMAINGFKRNPLLGSGYSTLNKTQPIQFTEAESTDNDYLRALGETGLLGFLAFFGTIFYLIYLVWRNINNLKDPIVLGIAIGFGGILIGLLTNAVYIDVFESSKVAFTFWAFAGLTLAGIKLVKFKNEKIPLPSIPGLKEFRLMMWGKITNFLKSDGFKLIIILIIAYLLRTYKIHSPLADWHSWRQSDTSAVTRNFVKHGVNLLYPTYDDLSNVASGKDNPKGLRFVEFPLYNFASVISDKIFVGYNIEYSGRMTSILASLFTIIFLFKLTRKYLGIKGAVLTSLFYAILPYNIFYNRVILPEPFMTFTSMGALYFLDKGITVWKGNPLTKGLTFISLSCVFAMASILIKPFFLFLVLPMAYLWFKGFGYSVKSLFGIFSYFLISILPFIWWRFWMSQFPEGIPANMWLLNGDNIRFKGAFFYWLFADRLSRLILGYWGLVLLVLGLLYRIRKADWFFNWWGISMLCYVTVVATGNIRHDYYQIMTIPIITIFLTKGALFLLDMVQKIGMKFRIYILVGIIIIFMEMFGWYHIRDFYNINHPEIVSAGFAVEKKTKENALVIAPYNGDTAFLYQTNRAGWPILQDSVESLIKKGADYYVSVNFDELTKRLIQESIIEDLSKRKYKLIELTDKYVIIQLVSDQQLPR